MFGGSIALVAFPTIMRMQACRLHHHPVARFFSQNGGCRNRSEEHTSELQSLMRISYAVFCLKKKKHLITSNKSSDSFLYPSDTHQDHVITLTVLPNTL